MAKSTVNIPALSRQLIEEARQGSFRSVYLLMGDEPFYPDKVCDAIIANCVDETFKDFNEIICYGSEVSAEQVVSAARQYPMMGDRLIVVVKEAQLMKDLEQLQYYCASPLETTVLVVVMHKASADKRKAFYKGVQKVGVVLESPALRDYEITNWIIDYYASRGLRIDPQAAQLLGESAGTDLCTIEVETDKLLKNLPEGTVAVTVADIEKNVGVSRQFSIFELTKALSARDASTAVRVATYVGSGAKFAMPMATSALYTHFYRILRYAALLSRDRNPSPEAKAKALAGVNPYFYREYDQAVRNYPLQKAMAVMSLLAEYDFKGKGGDVGDVPAGTLLVELVTKILNV